MVSDPTMVLVNLMLRYSLTQIHQLHTKRNTIAQAVLRIDYEIWPRRSHPKPVRALNVTTPSIRVRSEEFYSCKSSNNGDGQVDDILSSPFVTNILESSECENTTSMKLSRSPIERETTSPLKIFKSRTIATPKSQSPAKSGGTERSSRKLSSPEKRFPVKKQVCLQKQDREL